MPDKDDPKYKARYEREVEAGRKFASASGINWLSRKLQEWGQSHKVAFLVIVFSFIIFCFMVNVIGLVQAYHQRGSSHAVAVERVDKAMHERLRSK